MIVLTPRQEDRLDTEFVHGLDLVLNKTEEGRNDDGEARKTPRGALVAERFASARGHEDKDVPSLYRVFDHFLLAGTKGPMAKFVFAFLKDIFDVARSVGDRHYRSITGLPIGPLEKVALLILLLL